jgi:hypothetical protein
VAERGLGGPAERLPGLETQHIDALIVPVRMRQPVAIGNLRVHHPGRDVLAGRDDLEARPRWIPRPLLPTC